MGRELDAQRTATFALAATLGDVMATHPQPAVVWDVRNLRGRPGKRVKASRSDRESGYHTDAGYLDLPPRYFLLYAVRAASCGGGVSLIRDGRTVIAQLQQTEQGRAALRVLSESIVPRVVTPKYRPFADVAADGFHYSPILAQTPLWRWGNKNTGDAALRAKPEYATPQVRQAIATVADVLEYGPHEYRMSLPTDALIVVDNHIAFHGRTAFTDPDRHLLRIRFHQPSPADAAARTNTNETDISRQP